MPIPSQGIQNVQWCQRKTIFEQKRPSTSMGFESLVEQSGTWSQRPPNTHVHGRAPFAKWRPQKGQRGATSHQNSHAEKGSHSDSQARDEKNGHEAPQKGIHWERQEVEDGKAALSQRPAAISVEEGNFEDDHFGASEAHKPSPNLSSPARTPFRSPGTPGSKRKKVSRAEAQRYNLALDEMQMEGLMNSLEGINAAAPGAPPFSTTDAFRIRSTPGQEKEIIKETLRSLIFTSMLSEQHIGIIASESSLRYFDAGEIIVREGEDCVSLYILIQGRVGEYRDLEDFGWLTVADPIRLQNYLVTTLSQPRDVFCAMSVFTGAPAHSLYAAVSASVIVRLPTVAYQPILVNQPTTVHRIAEILLGFLLAGSYDDATRISLANRIMHYHQQFSRDQPGISWKLSPRTRAHHPRAWHKQPDKMRPIPCDPDEKQPCVGTKDGTLKPPSHLRTERYRGTPSDVAQNTHLSPRLYQRDFSQGVSCSWGLSRRKFDDVIRSNKASSVQENFADKDRTETWRLQDMLIEQPLVKPAGVTPCHEGFHRCFGSRGSTTATLEELNPSVENPAQNRTKLAREVLLARAKAVGMDGARPSYACELKHEAHDSQMRAQLQGDNNGTAYWSKSSRESVPRGPASSWLFDQELPPSASYECRVRHQFRAANMPGVFEHRQYRAAPARTDPPPRELADRAAIPLDDERLAARYPGAFPAEPTHSMLKTSPHLVDKDPARLHTPEAARRRLTKTAFRFEPAPRPLEAKRRPASHAGHRETYGEDQGEGEGVVAEEETWASMIRTADTTGLVPPQPTEQPLVTYACEMRKQTPFVMNTQRRPVVKPSHRFTSMLAHARPAPMPTSTTQEALERSSRPTTADIFRDNAPGFKNWSQSLQEEWHDNDMFAVLTHPAAKGGMVARRGDRTLHDGVAARSRAQEEEESGKPLVVSPVMDKTRLALHAARDGHDVAGPTWVCLERNKTHG